MVQHTSLHKKQTLNQDRATKANDTQFNICCSTKYWMRVGLVERLLRLVEYSFNLCWATCAHFGANFEMADEKMLLSLCVASVVAVVMKFRKKRRKYRKTWTWEWLKNRTSFGPYYTLLAELKNHASRSHVASFSRHVGSFHQAAWHQTRKRLVDVVQQTATCWKE